MSETPKNKHERAPVWASTDQHLLPSLLDNGMAEVLFDLLDDGIVVHDEQRTILLVNKSVEILTGVSRTDLLGRDCHSAFPDLGLCGSACAFKDPDAPENTPRMHETAFTRPDGELRYIKVKSAPIIIGDKKMGVLATIRDNSELEDLRFRFDKRRKFHGMIAASRAMGVIFETIRAVGPSDYPVLIMGESGTGKELVAQAIHQASGVRTLPLIKVNCPGIPAQLFESELFGHMKGAFTSAFESRKGKFELAEGGNLLLDEVSELPLDLQAKLLRVVESRRFTRVGGSAEIDVRARIIAATNRDLSHMVRKGKFREDLFYRLNVFPIALPSLRIRKEDICEIALHMLSHVSMACGLVAKGISKEAMKALEHYHWPGNVRELRNILERALVLNGGGIVDVNHLPWEIQEGGAERSKDDGRFNHSVETFKKKLLLDALSKNGWVKKEAAQELGLSQRALSHYVVRFGLDSYRSKCRPGSGITG